jgi:hypothetical protein
MYRRLVWLIVIIVSEEYAASIFLIGHYSSPLNILAAYCSEKSVRIYQTTRYHIGEYNARHIFRNDKIRFLILVSSFLLSIYFYDALNTKFCIHFLFPDCALCFVCYDSKNASSNNDVERYVIITQQLYSAFNTLPLPITPVGISNLITQKFRSVKLSAQVIKYPG